MKIISREDYEGPCEFKYLDDSRPYYLTYDYSIFKPSRFYLLIHSKLTEIDNNKLTTTTINFEQLPPCPCIYINQNDDNYVEFCNNLFEFFKDKINIITLCDFFHWSSVDVAIFTNKFVLVFYDIINDYFFNNSFFKDNRNFLKTLYEEKDEKNFEIIDNIFNYNISKFENLTIFCIIDNKEGECKFYNVPENLEFYLLQTSQYIEEMIPENIQPVLYLFSYDEELYAKYIGKNTLYYENVNNFDFWPPCAEGRIGENEYTYHNGSSNRFDEDMLERYRTPLITNKLKRDPLSGINGIYDLNKYAEILIYPQTKVARMGKSKGISKEMSKEMSKVTRKKNNKRSRKK
jgi:hypothetical protein